jgi:hypothetical protein
MSCSDETTGFSITALDRHVFATSAGLATARLSSYQQGFIHLECLS